MNKRIKELEKQATTVVEGWSDENGTTRYYEFDRKKFAELIVRECMSLVSEPGPDMNDTERGILAQIKQHFGVEE